MDLKECYDKGFIRKVVVNRELVLSLIDMSDADEKTVKEAKLNKSNISSYVAMAYDSLRELTEAICISKGYKVVNHICMGELLDSILDNFQYKQFDRVRWIRNSIKYYGNKIDFEQGKEIIHLIFKTRNDFKKRYLGEFK